MREWRNWQTRTFEGRVVYTVRVQVPFLAPDKNNPNRIFLIGDEFGLFFFERFEDTHFRNGVVKRPMSKPRGPGKSKKIKLYTTGGAADSHSLLFYSQAIFSPLLLLSLPAASCDAFHAANSRRPSLLS